MSSTSTPPKTTNTKPAPAGTTTVAVTEGAAVPKPAAGAATGAKPAGTPKTGGAAPDATTRKGKPAAAPVASSSTPKPEEFGAGVGGDIPDITAEPEGEPEALPDVSGETTEPAEGEAEGEAEAEADEAPAPIEYTFTTPEGHEPLANEVLAPLSTWLNEQQVPPEKAQALIDAVVPALQASGQKHLEQLLEQGEAELREKHGNKLPELMRLAALGAKQFGPRFRALLAPGGLLSRSVDTIEGLAAIGRIKSNDRPPRGNPPVARELTAQEEAARAYDEAEKKLNQG